MRQRKVYLASSWRNRYQPRAVETLRRWGNEVYDFRNPTTGLLKEGARGVGTGFQWSEIDPQWVQWTTEAYLRALDTPVAVSGFCNDWEAMQWADTGVLLLPCGRSAHLEAGYFVGAGKDLYVVHIDEAEPELMYKMATANVVGLSGLRKTWLAAAPGERR